MTREEIKKVLSENAELKRLLQQKDKKIACVKAQINDLKKDKKAISSKLGRSKKREKGLKSALTAEQKKTFDSP